MGANTFLFKANQGKKTTLDKAYIKHINSILRESNEEEEARWETYIFILQSLINDGKDDCYNEIRYRLTDGENPNEVILEIIERESESLDNNIWFFKKRIEDYIEEDYFKKYFN